MELWPYQQQIYMDSRKAFADGFRRLLVQVPTGGGKTVIASRIIKGASERDTPTLFFAHRRELIYQTSQKLEAFGVPHGMIMSGEFHDHFRGVQVASVDTFRARVMRKFKHEPERWPDAKLVFIDEAHRALAPTYDRIIEHYLERGAVIMGLTATPIRGDGQGLGNRFDYMIQGPSIAELIKNRYLVQPVHFAPTIPDLTGVKTVRGDYNEQDLQQLMDQRDLVGDIVTHWMRLAKDRKTIVFAAGVQHSIHLRNQFMAAGINAAHIDGNTPEEDRDRIIADLRAGKIQVICNCMVLTEGFDCPDISAVVLARPTKNFGLYLQMAGRGLRIAGLKQDCMIIDHAGSVYEHGKVDDPYNWSLEITKDTDEDRKKTRKLREQTTINCEKCGCVYSGQLNCPNCNHTPERKGQYIETKDGELVQVEDIKRPPNPRDWRRHEKVRWYNQFVAYGEQRGWQRTWAHNRFKDKFGEWPAKDFPVVEVTVFDGEFLAYIKYLNIKFAKGKQRQERERADIYG